MNPLMGLKDCSRRGSKVKDERYKMNETLYSRGSEGRDERCNRNERARSHEDGGMNAVTGMRRRPKSGREMRYETSCRDCVAAPGHSTCWCISDPHAGVM